MDFSGWQFPIYFHVKESIFVSEKHWIKLIITWRILKRAAKLCNRLTDIAWRRMTFHSFISRLIRGSITYVLNFCALCIHFPSVWYVFFQIFYFISSNFHEDCCCCFFCFVGIINETYFWKKKMNMQWNWHCFLKCSLKSFWLNCP